ncbi:TonB-dependent receptor domain-containing protein, partial [Brevundimonas sp.]
VYRGYQGTSNRSFVDPDFISHIAIEKGPSMGNAIAGGIGGSITMSTLTANDIVPEGQSSGMKFRISMSGNTSEPRSTETRNLLFESSGSQRPMAALRGVGRPAFLEPTGGSGSFVFAQKTDRFDLVAGYAFRRSGNYHAGTRGDGVPQRLDGPSAFCASGQASGSLANICANAPFFFESIGSTPFVGGEEVLNTSSETESVLLKATIRLAADHALELGYGGYWGTFGENYPTDVFVGSTVNQRADLSQTSLDRFTARYRWNPVNDLVDLKANLWFTQMRENSAALVNTSILERYVDTTGADISNSSVMATPMGRLSADYGVSYLLEDTGPVGKWLAVGQGTPGREGEREEFSLFGQIQLEPTSWLTLNGGLRYQDYSLKDYQSLPSKSSVFNRSEDAFSFSLGATLIPADGWQVFASYKQAARLPSLMEATAGFFMVANPDLHKEEARNWELGVNYVRSSLFSDDDELGLKLVWFDNKTDDYIARRYIRSIFQMQMYNIDRAQFRGLEASANYRIGDFKIDAGATWYDKILFCRPDETCVSSSLASDYATNYIPPEFAANLTVSKDFFGDRLNLGARAVYRGERAVDFEPTDNGYAPLLAAVPWDAHATLDLTGKYRISQGLTVDWSVENLTDRYYVEPLNLGKMPAPGRTFRIGLTGQFGGDETLWSLPSWFAGNGNTDSIDWSGAYVGASFGYVFGKETGTVTDKLGLSVDGGRIDESFENVAPSLHAGFNWQLANNVVLGLEADVATGALDSSSSVMVSEPDAGNLAFYKHLESSVDYSWDRFSTLRARIGYSLGSTLVYGTGGAAFLRETQTRTQFRSNNPGQAYGDSVDVYFTEETKINREGWTLGAGFERAIGERLSLRAEYLYADFGRANVSFDKARAGVGRESTSYQFLTDPVTGELVFDDSGWFVGEWVTTPGSSDIVNGRKSRTDADLHTVRIGLSYRF